MDKKLKVTAMLLSSTLMLPGYAEGPIPHSPSIITVGYTVGQQVLGGVVFWVDENGTHGLIAAKEDTNVSSEVVWGAPNVQVGAASDGIYAGSMNTGLEVARQFASTPANTTNYAALICANYSVQTDGTSACASPGIAGESCYGDWYLPSKFELNQLYIQKTVIGGFADDYYWSSTESSANGAWRQNFTNGEQGVPTKANHFRVRCIRAF